MCAFWEILGQILLLAKKNSVRWSYTPVGMHPKLPEVGICWLTLSLLRRDPEHWSMKETPNLSKAPYPARVSVCALSVRVASVCVPAVRVPPVRVPSVRVASVRVPPFRNIPHWDELGVTMETRGAQGGESSGTEGALVVGGS
ncbi:hypothetical protein C8R44DRAFT_724546 [Mycena epipterygia]|nr:hypothetical protein C8R44DRAFT_724546 [Mycena epipterygia]